MYLKSIEMQGFKSFPDRTKLVFDPGHKGKDQLTADGITSGVTVIVGPNGSGKSNIADAMRWVLGEVSSKSLRGSKMEDVIFGGADSRRPMGYAEVSVTFDNTVGFGRLDRPYDEITVTRRYYRSGNSDYLINRQKVLLRDIYELFLNTGIGRDGYSIIGQGRIADMVSRKSEERRTVFEDASGIAKYRVKKNESERTLDHTEENLVRLRDIFSEVESRVEPLEREANKARRGITLLEAKKRADISLWLYDTEHLSAEITAATEVHNHAKFDLQQAEDTLEGLYVQNGRLTEMTQGSRATSEALQTQITALTAEQHKLESEYCVTATNIQHTEDLIRQATDTRAALTRQLEADRAQLETHREKCSALGEALAGIERRAADNTAEIEALTATISRLDEQIATSGEDIVQREDEVLSLKVRISVLESTSNSDSDRSGDILTDMEEYETISKQLGAEVDTHQKAVDGYNEKYIALTEEIAEADRAMVALNEEYGALFERLNSEKLRRDSVTQRIQTHRAMEEQLDGYAGAVKFVMKRYREGRITGYNGEACGEIYGPLSQLISVEEAYITAVETALGVNLQYIVLENEATATAAMYALKRENAGRSTFFPLSSMRPQHPTDEMRRAAGYPGYIAVADTLVETDGKFRTVVSSLLGRTVVFDTIEHARAMAKSLGYRVRVVTLDGQQINVGGSFTGGSSVQKNGALSRAAEVRHLEEEVGTLTARVAASEKALAELRTKLKETEDTKNAREDKRDLVRVLMEGEVNRLNMAKANLEANETLIARMKEDCEEILRQNERNEETRHALTAELTGLTAALDELRAFRTEKAAEKGDAEDRVDQLNAVQTRLTIELSATRKDVETEETLSRMCEERMGITEGEIRTGDERVEALRQRIEEHTAAQIENRRLYAEGEIHLAGLLSDRSKAEEQGASYEAKLASLGEKIREHVSHKDNLFRAATTAEAKLQKLQEDMDKLAGRLWEDYEISRTEAQALGYPPVTADNRREVLATQTECRNKLRAIGHFDPDAVEKYNEVKARYETMKGQIDDLERSKANLLSIISDLETEMKTDFVKAFNAINEHFGETFSELFGGGSAEIILTDPENVLESGIEIKAAPPGKIIKSLMQLSGGEQAFIGVALFFAILKVNPTPFCILDEIEAALDEVNVERLAQYIKRYSDETQFIMITHRRGTMAAATRLYGVTMPERGISKVLTLDVADISKNKENDWNGIFS